MLRSLVLFLLLITLSASQELTGKIVSCSGWALNRLRELKSFLKDGEAEEYQNVQVEYVHGRKAILYIYQDGEEVEQITLSEYKTKEDMHNLMVEKGFVKKPEEELAEIRERRLQQEKGQQRAQEARDNAQGLGVDFIEGKTVEDVGEEKARVWRASAEAAQKAIKEKKENWKDIALAAEAQESKILNAEKAARRRAMEL